MSDEYPFGPIPADNERQRSLRTKLQTLWQRAMTKLVLAYGGVWRVVQDDGSGDPLAHIHPLTTSWSILTGFTENRPNTSKGGVKSDYTTGRVYHTDPGVYAISFTVGFSANQGRYVDFGVRINGVDPLAPTFRQEVVSGNGIEELSYTTLITLSDPDQEYYLVVKGEINMDMEFYFGGWALSRQDYISEDDASTLGRVFS